MTTTEVIQLPIDSVQVFDDTQNIHHLSYSTAKKIYRKGIDYALGTKLGLIEETWGKAADIGTMIHARILGGDPQFVISPYDSFRTKEAQIWKKDQEAEGLTIITQADLETIRRVEEAVNEHPLASALIDLCELEQRLTATIDRIEFLGYADGISKDRKILFDLKTTAQFDAFKGKYFAMNQDFDLQASVYRLFGATDQETGELISDYYFIVAESVAPFRVQVFGTSLEFHEEGNKKLQHAIEEFHKFRQRPGATDLDRISFNIGETEDLNKVEQLGDWS